MSKLMSDDISILKGKTLTKIEKIDIDDENDRLIFTTSEDEVYTMYHPQDCCEEVYIEDIIGDLDDLIGSSIVMAEMVCDTYVEDPLSEHDYSYTWTFYKLATIKGYVTIRWYGTSSGEYSEEVAFVPYRW